jgi:outer membrane murein-binding lipoprotein Lpp
MSGEPDSLVLVYLRRIDAKIDRLIDDVQDLKHRVTWLEGQVASIRGDMAAMSLRIDRIETRLDRIERRLDLVPATTA